MKLTRVVGLLLAVGVLAGCGATDTASPADKALRTYFDGIATQTVDSLRDAVDAAAPGSPAAAYATYLRASTQAATDGGQAVDRVAQTADRTAAGFKFCQGSGSEQVCFEYTDITRSDGKVSNFSINDKPISDRLGVGDGRQVRFTGLDASAAFVAGYETTASAKLFVVVKITSGADTGLVSVTASYQSPGARPSASVNAFGPTELDHGSSAHYLFAFPNARIGGTVTLSTADADGHTATVTVETR